MIQKDYYKSKAEELKKSLKSFPADFIKTDVGESITLPDNVIYPGREFFGKHEITFSGGIPWRICDNLYEAKYLIYAKQNGNKEVIIPDNDEDLKKTVTKYELYLDLMMKEIKKEYSRKFPGEDNAEAVAEIFKYLNLIRY